MAEKYDRRKNLVSLKDRTPEERAELQRKGQAASVEARRRKKTLRELWRLFCRWKHRKICLKLVTR